MSHKTGQPRWQQKSQAPQDPKFPINLKIFSVMKLIKNTLYDHTVIHQIYYSNIIKSARNKINYLDRRTHCGHCHYNFVAA